MRNRIDYMYLKK